MRDSESDYVWALLVGSGHPGCDGHEFDDEARRITCTCGVVLVDTPEDPEQAILAAIGIIAVLYQALRMLGWAIG